MRAQGAFCTVQPFWELIEFIYQNELALTESGTTRLYLFKTGLLPDPSSTQIATGSRLVLGLSKVYTTPKALTDAVTALLMHVASASSAHEEHLYGLELCFGTEGATAATIWYAEGLARDEGALEAFHDEIAEEALNVGGADTGDFMHMLPFVPADSATPLVTRAVARHPNPLLNELQVRGHTRAPPWMRGGGDTR